MNSTSSSMPTPTSGATRSWAWKRCCRRSPTRTAWRQHDRLQRARRAHGLAAVGAAAQPTRCRWCAMPPRPAWTQGLHGRGAEGRLAHDELRGPGHPDNWPRNMFVWRSNMMGSSGKGHEYFLKHLLGTSHGVQGKDLGQDQAKPQGSRLARQGARRQAGPAGDARLPHEHHLPVLGHRAADRDLVREERPQHQRHAPLHPPAVDGGRSGLAVAQRLGNLQGLREEIQRGLRRPPGRRARDGADPAAARLAAELAQPFGVQGLEAWRVST
jgi:hypothetical protein